MSAAASRAPHAPRRLDPGHGLLDRAPPRPLSFGRFLRLSTCSVSGALGLAGVLVGLVVEAVILLGKLFGAELKGLARYGEVHFHLVFGGVALLGVGAYVLFFWRRRRHFALRRDGVAAVGEVTAVEVVSRRAWWRRTRAGGRFGGAEMGRYRVRFRFAAADGERAAEDVVDTRHGNGQLCRLPAPRPGDRLTVLFDPRDPAGCVLALAFGEGLADP